MVKHILWNNPENQDPPFEMDLDFGVLEVKNILYTLIFQTILEWVKTFLSYIQL